MTLATTADYTAITGTELPDGSPELARVELLLGYAESAVLAGAHGQLIAATTITDLVVRPYEGLVYLPQRPVRSVITVTYEGVSLTEGTGFRVQAGGDGRPALLIRLCDGRDSSWLCDVTVTYQAGWDPIPGQIIGMCVAMAKSMIDNDGGAGMASDTAGPFSSSWEDAQPSGLGLTQGQQATLDKLCGVRGPASIATVRDYP